MPDLDFLVPVTLFLSLAIVFVLRGPLGRALADRLGARHPAPDVETHAELEELRRRLAELEERLDFAERLLARQAEQALPPLKR